MLNAELWRTGERNRFPDERLDAKNHIPKGLFEIAAEILPYWFSFPRNSEFRIPHSK